MVATSLVGLAATAGVLAAPTPTQAAVAACPGATGVTVIVDYNEIGGPTRAGCDPDGGGESASAVFPAAGFSLEYHPRQPGYVCKVTGLPTDRPCLENDSFWSLWWSDARSGEWRFSNQGVSSLTVPDGGYLAFSWHEGAGNAQPPDVAPTAHQAPAPTDEPTRSGGGQQGGGTDGHQGGGDNGGGPTSSGPATATTTAAAGTSTTSSHSASPDTEKKRRESKSRDATSPDTSSSTVPGAEEITAGPPSSDLATDLSDDEDGALVTWIGLALAAVVLGAAGLLAVLRRRSG